MTAGRRTGKAVRSLRAAVWRSLWISFSCVFLYAGELLAAGGKPATRLVNVADTRGLESGLTKWIADIYNTDLWLFGALVVAIMAGMGFVLGSVFDRLMGLLGIKLGKLEHQE
ncbi:MAG: hypothetical protein AB1640_10205 [bacterium]